MLKPLIANPLLTVIVRNAFQKSGPVDLSSGWPSVMGLCPTHEKTAETPPLEWLAALPASLRDRIDQSMLSSLFTGTADVHGHVPRDTREPSVIAASIYTGDQDHSVVFSAQHAHAEPGTSRRKTSKISKSSKTSEAHSTGSLRGGQQQGHQAHPLSMGYAWNQDGASASAWVIDCRRQADAWIELGACDPWDPLLAKLCLRLGAGLWIHPPHRSSDFDKCQALVAALDHTIQTPGWDQWVWPLSDALEFALLERLTPHQRHHWSPCRSPVSNDRRGPKWVSLPDWAWSRANALCDGNLGLLCLAIASRLPSSQPSRFTGPSDPSPTEASPTEA